MKKITKKIKEICFAEQLEKITLEEYLDISRNLDCGKWDNRLGNKPERWDKLPKYSNSLSRITGKLSKQDIQFYAMPKIPYIRKCISLADKGNNEGKYRDNCCDYVGNPKA